MKRMLLLFVAILFSPTAFAVDGVVLINQSTIINGLPGCPGPNPGNFPIVICQPGSYRLSGNLTVASTSNAINITSGGVTLDLNGFAIMGPASCPLVNGRVSCTGSAGFGIFVTNQSGGNAIQSFAIRNGTVENFLVGIHVSFLVGIHGIVEEIVATGNLADGMDVLATVVRRCNTSFNGQTGIDATSSTVTENVANFNNSIGIAGEVSRVIGNTANGNTSRGLLMSGGLFGSNELIGDGSVPIEANDGAINQGNNDCGTGSPC